MSAFSKMKTFAFESAIMTLFKGGYYAGRGIIMATQEELKKLHVVRKAIERNLTQKEAAGVLNLTKT